jgi:hypothetical protein
MNYFDYIANQKTTSTKVEEKKGIQREARKKETERHIQKKFEKLILPDHETIKSRCTKDYEKKHLKHDLIITAYTEDIDDIINIVKFEHENIEVYALMKSKFFVILAQERRYKMYKFIKKNNPEYKEYKKDILDLLELGASKEEISNLLEIHIKNVKEVFDSWVFDKDKKTKKGEI